MPLIMHSTKQHKTIYYRPYLQYNPISQKANHGIDTFYLADLLSLNIHYYYSPQMAITHSLGPHHIEIYFYSLAWLLYALGALLVDLYQHKPILRKLALLIMLLTVGKVFLYDARFLEGLMCALSFFCLGISLLGLHFLYTRTGHRPSQATPKP